jgi:hypothetical protein
MKQLNRVLLRKDRPVIDRLPEAFHWPNVTPLEAVEHASRIHRRLDYRGSALAQCKRYVGD